MPIAHGKAMILPSSKPLILQVSRGVTVILLPICDGSDTTGIQMQYPLIVERTERQPNRRKEIKGTSIARILYIYT